MCGTPPAVRRISAEYRPPEAAVAAAGARTSTAATAAVRTAGSFSFMGPNLRRHRLDIDVGERVRLVGGPQAVRRVAGDQPAAADERDLLAQLLRLLEVVGGEEDRRSRPVEPPDVAPQLQPQLEVDAGGRL